MKRIEPRFSMPCWHTTNDQSRLVPQVLAERARRALWSDCERRPLSMDREIA